MVDDLTRSILEQRDNIENQRNKEINSNREYYIKKLENKIQQLKDKIKQLEKCYCNRSDCSGRIKDSRKYDSVVQQLDKYKEVIDKATKFYTRELFKREQLPIPENMPWESVEMFNILEGNK